MSGDVELEKIIRKYVLLNAYKYNGKADVGAVTSKLLAERPELKSTIRNVIPEVKQIVADVNRLSFRQQLSEIESEVPEALVEKRPGREKTKLPPLVGAQRGKVVTRFPPEPNGYPHIGHAKAALIGETYARLYDGRFILRFDDTNPAVEKLEYYEAWRTNLAWLGIKPDSEKNTSDDIEKLHHYGTQLIAEGHAYVCTCDPQTVKSSRMNGTECGCREKGTEDRLERWDKMFSSYRQNEAIVRLKVDLNHVNTTMRDPTLFRIIEKAHPLKGDQYRVWPTYDFAVPIEDSIDGVTHAMRSKEYELRDELYRTIINLLGLRRIELVEFARLQMKGTPVSKRILKLLVEKGEVAGWDDPRLPTLLGLARRGFRPEAIREFVLSMGVTKTESEPTWDLLISINRKLLDSEAKRYFFVKDSRRLLVENAPKKTVTLKFHPDMDLGERKIETMGEFHIPKDDFDRFNIGDTFRLIELYNIKVKKKEENLLTCEYAGGQLTTVPKVQWVLDRDNIPFKVMIIGPLFENDKLNLESLKIVTGLAESSCKGLRIGESIQFVRFGFCRIDGLQTAILTHK